MGGWSEDWRVMLNSTQDQVEVEVEVEVELEVEVEVSESHSWGSIELDAPPLFA